MCWQSWWLFILFVIIDRWRSGGCSYPKDKQYIMCKEVTIISISFIVFHCTLCTISYDHILFQAYLPCILKKLTCLSSLRLTSGQNMPYVLIMTSFTMSEFWWNLTIGRRSILKYAKVRIIQSAIQLNELNTPKPNCDWHKKVLSFLVVCFLSFLRIQHSRKKTCY